MNAIKYFKTKQNTQKLKPQPKKKNQIKMSPGIKVKLK